MFPRPPGLTVLLPLALLLASGISRAQSILPSGGHTVAGTATVGVPAGNTLSITQTSPKAIVNWNTFSVGQPNTVQFNQPGSSAAILNRVTGAASSTIAGQIDGNGQVYLVNPNGIAITSTGSVQVGGGFVASTLGISNRNFMSGNLSFTGNGASAGVSNAGTISTGPGGYAALIGGTAANSGVISVPLGKVALGSGEAATLDLNGDGFMQVAVPTGATTAKGQALVSNSGRINASGGSVELRAATVATAIRDAVNMSGVIAANSVSGHDGAITLSGGPGGAVNVAGTLDASAAPASGAAGGAVQVSGARVRLGHHAVVNASGAQGGSVLVGVTAPGGVGAAQSTTIASGAQILAAGDPSVAGSGGYVETSGGTLQFGGATIDPGKGGTWLADPTNLTIDAAAATTISNTLNLGGDVFEETAGDGTTSGSGNTSSGAGDIIVDAAISWNTTNTLTLSAFNGITVNAPITISGAGNLVLTTNNNIGGTSTGNGVLTFTPTLGSLQFTAPEGSGQTLTINTLSYTLLYNVGEVQNINGNLSGNYALAIPLNAATDPTAPANWSPIGESTPFTGNFNGMGNTIANLTINDTTDDFVGLFGQLGSGSPNSGTISNLGLVGGSVTGSGSFVFVGELVGLNNFGGTISNSYATGAVSGSGSGSGILTEVGTGGLVGLNYGTITASYATGAVSGSGYTADVGGLVGYSSAGAIGNSYATGAVSGSGSFPFVGGLVGLNFGTTVTDAYAAGAVTVGSGTNSAAGGLVGVNDGTITDAYATGAVSGGTGAALGGLVGSGRGAADGYYDAGTTGMPYDGVVGLTTAQLQSTPGVAGAFNLSTGFANPGNWGIIPGVSYPYLTAFYPSTPQVISGIAYQDAGVTPLASSSGNYSGAIPANGTVSALVGGTNLGAVTTGANGYYYFLEPAGTVPSTPPGGGVLTYSPGAGASGGAAFADGITGGNATGLTIFGNTLHEITPDTANSTLQANLALALGSDPTATPLLAGLPNLQIDASGASFDIDSGILYPLGNVTLNVNALTESAGAITASGLAVNSIGSVDLPINNLVTTLAANVTGLGSTFDFSDAQTLTVGTVGSVSGVTTNGTDGSAANIVLATTSGDIDIEQPVSTNGSNGPVLGASLGEIGLDAAGNIVMNQSGSAGQLIAFGVEAFASGNIDLDGSANFFGNRIGGSDNIYGEAQTAGFFAGETTAAGDPLTFTDSNAGLTIGQLGVSAGSITLSAISGVYSNGGDIQIASLYPLFPFSGGLSTFNLTLDAPVNANNFVLGSPSTVLGKTPGLIQLIAQGGNLTQNATGVIIGGQLYAEADGGPNYLFGPGGNVELTADNRIGADDNKRGIAGSPGTYGRVAGFANNNFRFVNYDAPLTIDTLGCGCGGIFAYYGNIDLATKGAGDIAVDAPLNAGNNISIAVAEGYAFTNNAGNTDKNFRKQYITFIDEYYFTFPPLLAFPFTYGIDATAANGAVTILADQMNLSNGTIGGGIVVLGPKTHSEDIVLGTAGGSNTLSLQTADLANIVAGAVQVGYRLPDGAVSLTGDITISNKFAVNTDDIEGLLLVTGGSVNETGNGAIVGTDPSNPLELGIIASGSNSLDGANRVGTLAAYIDGANPSLSFTDARGLTVDTLAGFQAGVRLDAAGFPRARMTTGAVPDPLGGIVLAGGTTASLVTLTTTAGAITLNQPILAGAGTVTLDSARTVTEAEAGSITAGLLTGYSTGGALLVNPNVVSALGTWSDTGPRSAGFTLVDTEALTVTGGSVNSTGPVTLDVTAGDLILAPSALIIGDGIVLATTADFINDAGANVLALANGSRWLIYSDTPGGDMFGGLDSGNTAVWDVSYASLPPPSVTETGDRYLFQLSPTLTVTTVNDSKHYGTDDAAGIANDYVISGSVSGVAGAFLGDSLAALYTGTPSVTSAGSFALKFGGPFPVIATAGSLVALDGYQLSFVDGGELTVIGGPVFGASPEKYILPPPSWWGDLLTLQPGLTRCAPGSIAGALHDSGSVRLFGSGDESCGS